MRSIVYSMGASHTKKLEPWVQYQRYLHLGMGAAELLFTDCLSMTCYTCNTAYPHKHPKMLRCHVCAVKSTSFFFPQPSTCTRRNPKHSAQTEKCVTARNSCYRYYSYVLLYHWWIVALTARFFSLLVFATLSSLWLLQPSLLFGGKMNLNPKFHPFYRCFSWSLACSRKTPSVELCINILPMIFFQIRTSSRF